LKQIQEFETARGNPIRGMHKSSGLTAKGR
jgi:hypothetical protein